jgi:hypothetical protein
MRGQTEAGGEVTQCRSALDLDEARICKAGVLNLPEMKTLKSEPAETGRICDQKPLSFPS